MDKIKAFFKNYKSVVKIFGESEIKNKYSALYQQYNDFIDVMGLKDKVCLDETSMIYAVMDYFTDISRIKNFHSIKNVNAYKRHAYLVKWLLRRHPLQIVKSSDDTNYINENFCHAYLWNVMLSECTDGIFGEMDETEQEKFLGYKETVYYYLKYRNCDSQALELALMSFEAGMMFAKANERCIQKQNKEKPEDK